MKQVALAAAITVMALMASSSVASAAEVEGTVKSVDVSGEIVTLEDGTTLVLAPTSSVDREALKPGAHVKASYDSKDGKNMVTIIEVRQGMPMTPPASQDTPKPSK